MTMKELRVAAELITPKEPLVINKRPMIDLPAKGAIVNTHCAGLCHSDLHVYEDIFYSGDGNDIVVSKEFDVTYPIVLSHEIAGVISQVGSQFNGAELSVGSEVIIFPWVACNLPTCSACVSGCTNRCQTGFRFLGLHKIGGFSSHVAVPEGRFLVKKPSAIPMHVACLLPCSALTAYNAVSKAKPFIESAISMKGHGTLLINGIGGLGTWAVQFVRLLLPPDTKLITSDINQSRLKLSREYGADETIHILSDSDDKDVVNAIRSASVDGGIDAAIDFVGTEYSASRHTKSLFKGGGLINIGFFGGCLKLPLLTLVTSNLTIIGSTVGSLDQLKEIIQMSDVLKAPPVTIYSLSDVNVAIDKLRLGQINGRAVITHSFT